MDPANSVNESAIRFLEAFLALLGVLDERWVPRLSRHGSNAHAPPPFLVRNMAPVGQSPADSRLPSCSPCTLSPASPKTVRASPRR